MFSPPPIVVPLAVADADLEAALAQLPNSPAVFLLDAGQGQQPYLSRTSNLGRRLRRLLRPVDAPSRMLNLRGIARLLRYWPTSNALGAQLLLWQQARLHYPDRYRRMLRLRLPYYAVLTTDNRFPRAAVSRAPSRDDAAFGPFPSRPATEDFLAPLLDLFLLRRCDDELMPDPQHPGCIYGEMAMCLRPCQAAVADADYRTEARHFLAAMATRGESLRQRLQQEREAASDSLNFEAAALAHKRLSKLHSAFPATLGFARQLASLHGIAVAPGQSAHEATLWPVYAGHLQQPVPVPAGIPDAQGLRHLAASRFLAPVIHPPDARHELLAIFSKWLRSSWCDGLWVEVADDLAIPVRKLRNAIRRVASVTDPSAENLGLDE